MKLRLRPCPLGSHGGASRLPIDLSASLNPLGPSPAALRAARQAVLRRYPEIDAGTMAQAAALRHGLPADSVVAVPGASWGLWLAMVGMLRTGDTCVALGPCFGEYERYATIARSVFVEARCPARDLQWDTPAMDEALGTKPAICVLANPANPSGTRLPADRLRRLCAAHPETVFVVDEAFAGFAPAGTSLLDGGLPPLNALVVRSLTKELAMPGLRMGYLVADPELARGLGGLLPAWPLSAPAIAAATAGLGDADHLRRGAQVARRHLAEVAAALSSAGLRPLPTCANYLLCRAPGVARRLARHGVAVRDCASFDLPGYIRVAAPRLDDLPAVLEAIGA